MSEVTFPDGLHDAEARPFVSALLARDPNDRPRFEGIKNDPWMSEMKFDAASLKGSKIPIDWLHKHIHTMARARPLRSMRRSSTTSLNKSTASGVSLSAFIEDMCAQMIEIGKNEEAEIAAKRWTTPPTPSTKELFRHWNYISEDALELEMSVNATHSSLPSERHGRRATQ